MIGQVRHARRWCEGLARLLQVQHIRPNGTPYLDRYFAAGWNPTTKHSGPAIFLHHFLASDPNDAVHSHPWAWSVSVILVGGYREHRCRPDGPATVREYHPGDVNLLLSDDQHRIDLLQKDCWSLFLAGEFDKPWGFGPLCE
jgi:hypothetical protein